MPLVRVELLDGRTVQTIARPSQAWVEIAAAQSRWEVMGTYVVEGIRHILFGADHLLFVLGLLLIVGNGWMLVKTVTAFTVAHSITLGCRHARIRPGTRAAAQRCDRLEHPFSGTGDCPRVAR